MGEGLIYTLWRLACVLHFAVTYGAIERELSTITRRSNSGRMIMTYLAINNLDARGHTQIAIRPPLRISKSILCSFEELI